MLLVKDAGALRLWKDKVGYGDDADPRVEGNPEAQKLEGWYVVAGRNGSDIPEEYPFKPRLD